MAARRPTKSQEMCKPLLPSFPLINNYVQLKHLIFIARKYYDTLKRNFSSKSSHEIPTQNFYIFARKSLLLWLSICYKMFQQLQKDFFYLCNFSKLLVKKYHLSTLRFAWISNKTSKYISQTL